MARNQNSRWRCMSCEGISTESDILTAPNPFDDEFTIWGCPKCHNVIGFELVCDEPGCNEKVTRGFPVEEGFGGYRQTCHDHYSQFNKAKPPAS